MVVTANSGMPSSDGESAIKAVALPLLDISLRWVSLGEAGILDNLSNLKDIWAFILDVLSGVCVGLEDSRSRVSQ